jgi:hypothetical protein
MFCGSRSDRMSGGEDGMSSRYHSLRYTRACTRGLGLAWVAAAVAPVLYSALDGLCKRSGLCKAEALVWWRGAAASAYARCALLRGASKRCLQAPHAQANVTLTSHNLILVVEGVFRETPV